MSLIGPGRLASGGGPGAAPAVRKQEGTGIDRLEAQQVASPTAVHASRHTLPCAMQHSLPAGGLRLCRAGVEPAGSRRKVPGHPVLLPRALAWRKVIRFRGCGGVPAMPGTCPGRGDLSGQGQGGNCLAAVRLQPSAGGGKGRGLASVHEDQGQRDGVEAGPVGRAVTGAGLADAVTGRRIRRAPVWFGRLPVWCRCFCCHARHVPS